MNGLKKILFITGTRADFGKIKTLILSLQDDEFEVHVFVTGMHMLSFFGSTYDEVVKAGINNIYKFINCSGGDTMDVMLAKTIHGLGDYIRELEPDMIVVHGDRIEALAGAVVGSMNNILVAHIEGGEVSGTIDESIRHAISKLSHIHFVANMDAGNRLVQLGEDIHTIYAIGSPDLDVMASRQLPGIEEAKEHYEIDFDSYGILMFHPVTTQMETIHHDTEVIMVALQCSDMNWIVIHPNNDHGSSLIMDVYRRYRDDRRFRFYPSMRFEYFLTLLNNAQVLIGNSSTGIREAPYYGVPSVNLGERQKGRARLHSIVDIEIEGGTIARALSDASGKRFSSSVKFGDGKSTQRFVSILKGKSIWETAKQKNFVDISGIATTQDIVRPDRPVFE